MTAFQKFFAFATLTLILAAPAARAHEGHDHDAPKGLTAPKGGVIKALEQTLVEVVSKGSALKIYLYSHDLKPQDVNLYTVTAKAEKPRVKKQDEIPLRKADSAFEGTYDAKGLHRYTLILSVKDPKEDHADSIKFTIEPKK